AKVFTGVVASLLLVFTTCLEGFAQKQKKKVPQALRIEQNSDSASILIFREGDKEPILTQIAKKEERPYLHPIVAPDGKGVMTQFRPGHHLHQTGIYWG